MPRVSAVIPCYNHGRFIDRAVDSVLAQTYKDIEILIVNDGSTDPATIELLKNYPAERATVIHKENGHASSARNCGVARAKGEFILALDADDYFAPEFVEKALKVLDGDPQAGSVTCYVEHFGRVKRRLNIKSGGDLVAFLSHNCSHAGCLFRRQCWVDVGGYDENMKEGYEDWEFWIAVTRKGWLVRSIPEHLFYYHVSEQGVDTAADRRRPELVRWIANKHKDVYAEHIGEVLYAKEVEIKRLQEQLNQLKSTFFCRLGRLFKDPTSFFKGLWDRLNSR